MLKRRGKTLKNQAELSWETGPLHKGGNMRRLIMLTLLSFFSATMLCNAADTANQLSLSRGELLFSTSPTDVQEHRVKRKLGIGMAVGFGNIFSWTVGLRGDITSKTACELSAGFAADLLFGEEADSARLFNMMELDLSQELIGTSWINLSLNLGICYFAGDTEVVELGNYRGDRYWAPKAGLASEVVGGYLLELSYVALPENPGILLRTGKWFYFLK